MPARRNRKLIAAVGALGAIAAGLGVQRAHMRRVARDPENEVLRTPPSGRPLSVRSVDGTQIHVERFGPEKGRPVVLVHGWIESIQYWIYVIRGLTARGFRVIAYDLRGHGKSDQAQRRDYAIARFGEDLESVLEATLQADERALVVGHSLGAMSIAAWAEHHEVAPRTSGAVLLNTGVGDLLAENLIVPVPFIAQAVNRVLPPTALVGSRAPIPHFSTPVSHAAIRYFAFGPAATPAQVAFFERMLVACPPDVRADVGIAISEIELYDALARLTVPAVVIAGDKDRLTPASHARRIAESLPELRRLVVLRDTGHMAPLERPDEVIGLIADLAADIASGRDAVAA